MVLYGTRREPCEESSRGGRALCLPSEGSCAFQNLLVVILGLASLLPWGQTPGAGAVPVLPTADGEEVLAGEDLGPGLPSLLEAWRTSSSL